MGYIPPMGTFCRGSWDIFPHPCTMSPGGLPVPGGVCGDPGSPWGSGPGWSLGTAQLRLPLPRAGPCRLRPCGSRGGARGARTPRWPRSLGVPMAGDGADVPAPVPYPGVATVLC